jgi:NADH dehydrogenase
VDVLLQTRVQACTEQAVAVSGGEEIPCRTFIWAAGVAPCPILEELDLPRTRAGKIEVDATMAVKGHPGVWALGDSATIPDVLTGGVCPPTAQYALRQGRTLADNIAATIDGREPRSFQHKSLGLLAGLGRRCAVAEIMGLRFSGFFAWWLWRTIYLLKLPGFERKLRVMLDWTLDLFFARDIVYLRSLHNVRSAPAVSHPTASPEVCPIEPALAVRELEL